MSHSIHCVRSFKVEGPSTLRVRFEDDTEQVIDFLPILAGELYQPLRDSALFNKVRIDPETETLIWPNGANFDPATLHDWPRHLDEMIAQAKKLNTDAAATDKDCAENSISHEIEKDTARGLLQRAKEEYEELGGWQSFKSGAWLVRLILKSIGNYYEKANLEFFRHKYPRLSDEAISKKLISVAARNALIIGAVTGAVISTDEIVAFTTGAEGGVGLPANIAIAAAAIGAEMICLMRIQLQLVANLAKLKGCLLDPNDPEDILIILAYAIGGSVAEEAGRLGIKIGAKVTEDAIRKYISKEFLQTLKMLGRKVGIKILQRSIIKYIVPVVSMGIGGVWNFTVTRSVGKIAMRHFNERATCNATAK